MSITKKEGIKVVTKMLEDIKYREKWHRKQLDLLSIERDIYRALLLCRDEGAIMMSTGKIAQKVEEDGRFKIIGEGYMRIEAMTILDEQGQRQMDWRYTIDDESTRITIYVPADYSNLLFKDKEKIVDDKGIGELPYRIAIFQLHDHEVQRVCDELQRAKQGLGDSIKYKVRFDLQIMLVKSDLSKVTGGIEIGLLDQNNKIKPKFRKTEKYIDSLDLTISNDSHNEHTLP